MNNNINQIAKKIQLLICDVDGVMTDGGIYMDANGNQIRRFFVHDGYGLQAIMNAGIEVAIISAKNVSAVTHRMQELDIKHCYQGKRDKVKALNELMEKLNINLENIAYIGDDVIDLSVMKKVGFAVAVNNAIETIKPYAHYVTAKNGGQGAVREVCDLILNVKGEDEQ